MINSQWDDGMPDAYRNTHTTTLNANEDCDKSSGSSTLNDNIDFTRRYRAIESETLECGRSTEVSLSPSRYGSKYGLGYRNIDSIE